MHELSIASGIVEIVAEEAERRGGNVTAVHLKLGPLSGVVKEALQFAYLAAREGTALDSACLVIEDIPVVIYCSSCAAERLPASISRLTCPACGSEETRVLTGREIEITAMELES
jgi:hydrogenase nickel incorporation protein HypA/HybF